MARFAAARWAVVLILLLGLSLAGCGQPVASKADEDRAVAAYLKTLAKQELGWAWAIESGAVQTAGISATDRGYTVTVQRVLADAVETSVIVTVRGRNPGYPRRDPITSFDGTSVSYAVVTPGEVIDGVWVGVLELGPLPESDETLDIEFDSIGGRTSGSWRIAFPASRVGMDEVTRQLPIGREFELAGGVLTIEQMTTTPLHTAVDAVWQGVPPYDAATGTSFEPRLLDEYPQTGEARWGTRIVGADGAEAARRRASRMQRTPLNDGVLRCAYKLIFDRLPPSTDSMSLHIGARIFRDAETRVPLAATGVFAAADGRAISVIDTSGAEQNGHATIRYDYAYPYRPYFPWQVVDERGQPASAIKFSESEHVSTDDAVLETTYSWKMPAGSRAVALVGSGHFVNVELGEIQLKLK